MNSKGNVGVAVLLGVLTVLLIVCIKLVDVAAIGPAGSEIGLSHINQAFHDVVGVNMLWYRITVILGAAALVIALIFVIIGFVQMISRRSIFKVDRNIISLWSIYALVAGFYILFEKVIINYRPVLMDGETYPEASFPSTHTLIACALFGSTLIVLRKYIKNHSLRVVLQVLCVVLMLAIVIGRVISGVHWLTDIIGGVLISGMLIAAFYRGLRAR